MTYIKQVSDQVQIEFDSDEDQQRIAFLKYLISEGVPSGEVREKGIYFLEADGLAKHHYYVPGVTNRKNALYECRIFQKAISASMKLDARVSQQYLDISEVVVHNTKNVQSQSTLKLKNLLEEDQLRNETDKIQFISQRIRGRETHFARELLSLLKDFTQINFEYTVQEYLKPNVQLGQADLTDHRIYTIVQMAFYVFEQDLKERNITVSFERCQEYVRVHFNTFKSAVVQIFDNALKYCKPNSNIEITFNFSNSHKVIDIEMISLWIPDDEVGKIFDVGYRSNAARQISQDGKGLGLYLCKKLLELNGSSITFTKIPSSPIFEANGRKYCKNLFVIQLNGI